MNSLGMHPEYGLPALSFFAKIKGYQFERAANY